MIFVYYDKLGVLREIINQNDIRQGGTNAKILVYTERTDLTTVRANFSIGSINYLSVQSVGNITRAIPYNQRITYRYFQDNTPYFFYEFDVPPTIMAQNGLCKATFSAVYTSGGQEHSDNLGLLTFEIQDEVINEDDLLTTSQMSYLLNEIAKFEFFMERGVVGTLVNREDGEVAESNYKDGVFVLYYGKQTSNYDENVEVNGIKLYQVVERRYKLLYSSFADSDLIKWLETQNNDKSLQINQMQVDIADLKNRLYEYVVRSDLSQVAFTGNYNDLANKPTIPTQVSELTNNLGFITNATEDLINYYKKSETYTKDEVLEIVSSLETIKIEFAASLDAITQPKDNVIYFVGTQAPYTEYVYISNENRFEVIGETSIDLSSYVQTSETLNTNKLVVGNGAKNIKTTDYNVRDYGTSGIMLNSDTDIPTSKLVLNEISKYHAFFTINGDSGNLGATTIVSASDYKLIIDENLLVYRRISKQTGNIVYHSQEVIDGTHIRDYYLTFNANGDYVRTFVENVSHAEFDDLVVSTPTDIKYNTETKVAYLEHDGTQIGSGAVIDLNGYVPYYDGDTLVLSELEQFTGDVATKEYVDNNAGGVSEERVQEMIDNSIGGALEEDY